MLCYSFGDGVLLSHAKDLSGHVGDVTCNGSSRPPRLSRVIAHRLSGRLETIPKINSLHGASRDLDNDGLSAVRGKGA